MTPELHEWIKRNALPLAGGGLAAEVGSRSAFHQEKMSMKGLFPHHVGIDIEAGFGVDIQFDMTATLPPGHPAARAIASASVVLCLETLEHVPRFWRVLANIRRHQRPGTTLFVSVPGIGFPFHAHPVDCYRWTAEGLRLMLEPHWATHAPVTLHDTMGNAGHVIAAVRP